MKELLFALFIGLQIADVLTTLRALEGGATEANKIVKWLMDRIGVLPALIAFKALAIGIMLVALLLEPRWATYALVVVSVFYLAVIVNNVLVIRE